MVCFPIVTFDLLQFLHKLLCTTPRIVLEYSHQLIKQLKAEIETKLLQGE